MVHAYVRVGMDYAYAGRAELGPTWHLVCIPSRTSPVDSSYYRTRGKSDAFKEIVELRRLARDLQSYGYRNDHLACAKSS